MGSLSWIGKGGVSRPPFDLTVMCLVPLMSVLQKSEWQTLWPKARHQKKTLLEERKAADAQIPLTV